MSMQVRVLQRTAKKCTATKNARAQLFSLSKPYVLVAVDGMVCSGSFHMYPDIFESATFFSGYRFSPHASDECRQRIWPFSNPPSREEKILNESNNVWTGESGYFRYVWRGDFLNPKRKTCGFKNIRIRVDGALNSLISRAIC